MPRRRIGRETLGFDVVERASSLDALAKLIDWAAVDATLRDVYAAERGEAAWPPVMLFKALLLAVWHDLSDVKLADALDDPLPGRRMRAFAEREASFRRFCGFSRHEPTPERTAFVRFRHQLVARGLDAALFEAVTDQLRANCVSVKTGTLIDATVIGSTSESDAEAAGRGTNRARPSTATRRMWPPTPTQRWSRSLT